MITWTAVLLSLGALVALGSLFNTYVDYHTRQHTR